MPKLSRNHFTVVAATAAAAIAGTAVAGAAGTPSSSSSGTTTQRPAGGPGAGEKPLTGATKTKVQEAALAKVGGTVLRVETDNGGVYEAHIRKADGTEVEVKVNKDFEVTAVNAFDGRGGPGGRGGHGPMDLSAVATKLGVTEAKLQSAVDAARGTTGGKDKGARGDLAADLAKALGASTAKVQSILDANRPQPGRADRGARGPGGGPLGDSTLISALAKGLSQSEADVKAALTKLQQQHEADHTARETAFFAAVAKDLGKSAADVKAAFDAARPTR